MSKLFISHSSKDDAFVRELQQTLCDLDHDVWIGSRELRGGDPLELEIKKAIDEAAAYAVLVSPDSLQSKWVGKELRHALLVQERRGKERFPVIPLSLNGTKLGVLEEFFGEEPVYIPVSGEAGGTEAALNAILAALGKRLPADLPPMPQPEAQPLEDLVLELTDLEFHEQDGKRRASARARLVYEPATPGQRDVSSRKFWRFVAPIGPIEAEELRWYLEKYAVWPGEVFRDRARKVEQNLAEWGKALYREALPAEHTSNVMQAWARIGGQAGRRFSVHVDPELEDGAAEADVQTAREAATQLLGLPWELLHDGDGFLFQGAKPVRVRRRLPNTRDLDVPVVATPIRILLITARPEDGSCGYIDHRASALPLVEAVEDLGGLAELRLLKPPTMPGLGEALERARKAGKPFHVVHFDGHGVYDRRSGLGGLCFERPEDSARLERRRHVTVYTDELGQMLKEYRIPLVFLEACQTATAEQASESVASELLKVGVASVVAMSHSVLVETARRFVEAFYDALAEGARVGDAMLAGQRKLKDDSFRGHIFGAAELRLQDWFVPVLFQEKEDPQLFRATPSTQTRKDLQAALRARQGELPAPPETGFIGRSRELLALQRLLGSERYAVVRGQGGEGKTALACEFARWMVRSRQVRRAAFVSVESHGNAKAVLDAIGRQLVPNYSVATFESLEQAILPVERVLAEQSTLLVVDNMESVLLPPFMQGETPEALSEDMRHELDEILKLCARLVGGVDRPHPDPTQKPAAESRTLFPSPPGRRWPEGPDEGEGPLGSRAQSAGHGAEWSLPPGEGIGRTRIVFTSREALPAPFDGERNRRELHRLDREDAVKLEERVLNREGGGTTDATREQIELLVDAVHCHARTLALLAPALRSRGVEATRESLVELMVEMERRFPGSREQSVFASVELSLRRLSPENRERVRELGMFHGAVDLDMLCAMTEWEEADVAELAGELVETGLATPDPYNHLGLNPALCPYLRSRMDAEEHAALTGRWLAAMQAYVYFLEREQSRRAEVAATLTGLELPNLFALLERVQPAGDHEATIALATLLYGLLQAAGRPRLLERVGQVRDAAAKALGEDWNHATFQAQRTRIEQQLATGHMQEAYEGAQDLLQRARQAGDTAYPDADFDLAVACFLLGRVLNTVGVGGQALPLQEEAQTRFEVVERDRPGCGADRMASICLTEQGDCLLALGRLDEAAAAYGETVRRDQEAGRERDVAVGKGQLGTVRLLQRRYREALEAWGEALEIFDRLGEPGSVATAWHQIGMVYQEMGEQEAAEDAYRQSLAITVRLGDVAGQASALGQLGILYDQQLDRTEEAVAFFRQAADKHIEIGDVAGEGRQRGNLAMSLRKLSRLDEARREILRAIEFDQQFGHASSPWTAWGILADIETDAGNLPAATEARQKAIDCYLAYRRDGGENHDPDGRIALALTQMLQAGEAKAAESQLRELAANPDAAWLQPFIQTLQAIVAGSRDRHLADAPELDHTMAAEILFLIETLERHENSAQ